MKTIKVSDHIAEEIEQLAQKRGISIREAADWHFAQLERVRAKAVLLDKFLEDLGFENSDYDEVKELIENGKLAAIINQLTFSQRGRTKKHTRVV